MQYTLSPVLLTSTRAKRSTIKGDRQDSASSMIPRTLFVRITLIGQYHRTSSLLPVWGNVVTDLERTVRAICVQKEEHKERLHVKTACCKSPTEENTFFPLS